MDWMKCKICGFHSKHPDGRGLHKHIRGTHRMAAWSYYQVYADALRARIEASVDLVAHARGLGKCWVFRGRPTKAGRFGHNRRGAGYRDMRIAGAPTTAVHRLAVFAYTGYMPSKDEVVLHRCDNPGCCCPRHVHAGTQEENVYDRDRKGRTSRGCSHPASKLTRDQVLALRSGPERTNRSWADELGVSIEIVRRAVAGVSYRDVALPKYTPDDHIPF